MQTINENSPANGIEEIATESRRLPESKDQPDKVSGGDKDSEEKARLAAAVESTDEVIMIMDRQGKIEYVNPAFERTTGYAKKEVLGRSPVILGGGRHENSLYMGFLDSVMTGKTWAGHTINRKKNGNVVHFEGTISPVVGRTGRTISYVSVFQDITRRMKLESIAEAASSMNSLGYAFSGLRHELANILNSVKISFGVLQRKTGPGAREYLERVQAEIARMENLLKSFRNYNIYEDVEARAQELPPFLNDFVSLISEDFSRRGIGIRLEMPEGASAICDLRALKQVLLNLAANSADALENIAGAGILIRLFKRGTKAVIRMADNGAGMDEEQMKSLFKPFTTTKKQGTGLGLVIVKKMIARMGGDVQVTSIKGQGTSVDILLPYAGKPA